VRSGAKSNDAFQDAAGYLCQHAAEVRPAVGDACWTAAIPVITGTEPSSAAWREAIRAVHDAAEAAGIPGGLGLRFTMGGFPDPPPPRSSGWVCPGGSCSRVVLRDAADLPGGARHAGPGAAAADEGQAGACMPGPQCALSGQPMRLVE
jgi:hypothetical protein